MGWARPVESCGEEVIGWREFKALLRPNALQQVRHVSGLVRYPFIRLLDQSTRGPTRPLPTPPTSHWVTEARRVAAQQLPDPRWIWHSERTWLFATVLADLDGEDLEPELLYVASLLHDSALLMESRVRCFAVTGAEFAVSTADAAGANPNDARMVARAISSHISVCPDNELGRYLQAGSLLDVAGTRVWDLQRALVTEVCKAWPRTGFPAEVRHRWSQECALFPNGRAAFARFPGGMTLASHLAPLPRNNPT